jgi:REP element-mobilizing transposase RayT
MIRERKLLRLAGYDYTAPGAYFITACVHGRKNEFGIIENGVMQLNEYGLIVEQQWKWLFDQYDYLKTGEYCVMPNHFHGIIQITVGNGRDRSLRDCDRFPRDCDRSLRDCDRFPRDCDRFPRDCDRFPRDCDRSLHRGGKIKSIPELIGAFKTTSSKLIHIAGNNKFKWQKSYYDVIIRDDESFYRISEYIRNNPKHWDNDAYRHHA